jgi:hypothetical protein
MDRAELYVKMHVGCTLTLQNFSILHPAPRYPDISITRQEMLVVVTLLDINDNIPEFPWSELAVAYPDKDLARQILPGFIADIKVMLAMYIIHCVT